MQHARGSGVSLPRALLRPMKATTHGIEVPVTLQQYVDDWSEAYPLSPIHIDCATAVMLKILDGKCKMKRESMVLMELLYDAVQRDPPHSGRLLGAEIATLIAAARAHNDDVLRELIYEKRLLAETMISRPVMKGFKAMLREHGLFDSEALKALAGK